MKSSQKDIVHSSAPKLYPLGCGDDHFTLLRGDVGLGEVLWCQRCRNYSPRRGATTRDIAQSLQLIKQKDRTAPRKT